MLFEPPTETQLRATFDKALAVIKSGRLTMCPTDTGLSDDVVAALNAIFSADDKDAAVNAARAVFTRHLAGMPPHRR